MRRTAPLIIASALLSAAAAASAPVPRSSILLNDEVARARAEQAAAEKEVARLERAATEARDEAGRLRVEREAAAMGLDAAEARISAADAQLRLAGAYVANHRRQLAERQRPLSALLAGLAVMAQRPPLFALADRGSADELVKVRILLASTIPVISARTASLSRELDEGRRLQVQLASARSELVQSRRGLSARQAKFEALEKKALEMAIAKGAQALGAGDLALASGEDVDRLLREAETGREAAAVAAQMVAADVAPARPVSPETARMGLAPFSYRLPSQAPVTRGFGAVDSSGVKSRGITLATRRGAALVAPAAGVVRFTGPFRDYDGILIIDHGRGWLSLIVNIASDLAVGAKIAGGAPIGRALGPIEVELSQNGQRMSPALIAGSSASLSKDRKGG